MQTLSKKKNSRQRGDLLILSFICRYFKPNGLIDKRIIAADARMNFAVTSSSPLNIRANKSLLG
jgi:hypothetical protein